MIVSFFCKVRHDRPWCRPDRTVRTGKVMRTGLSRSDHTFGGEADSPDHTFGGEADSPDHTFGGEADSPDHIMG